MGTHHSSQVVFGVEPALVRARLTQWLAGQGYTRLEGPPLTELDAEGEQALSFAWLGDRTIVRTSATAGLSAQRAQLQALGGAVLELSVHDTDLWGYQLWQDGVCTSAFSSSPRYGGPPALPAGPNDVEALCGLTGADADAIRTLQSGSTLLAPGLARQLAELIGVPPAAPAPGPFTPDDSGYGFKTLWFRRHDHDPMADFDLAALRFTTWAPPPITELPLAEQASVTGSVWLGQAVAWGLGCLFAPLAWVIHAVRWWSTREVPDALQAPSSPSRARSGSGPTTLFEGRILNPRHRLAVDRPPGATLDAGEPTDDPTPVFALQLDGHWITCTAMNPTQVRALCTLGPAETSWRDRSSADGAVRTIEVSEGAADAPAWRVLSMRAGPSAVYIVRASGPGELPAGLSQQIEDLAMGMTWNDG